MIVIIWSAYFIYSKCNVNPVLRIDNGCGVVDSDWKTYQNGLDEWVKLWRQQARERLSVTGFCPPYEYDKVTKVIWDIESIDDDNILIKIKPIWPLSHPDLDYRLINLEWNINTYHMTEKNQDLYMKERAEFDKIMAEYIKDSSKFEKSPSMPDFFDKKEVNMDYTKLWTWMRVIIETSDDIRYEKNITPASFSVQSFSRDPSFKINFDKWLSILDFVEEETDVLTWGNLSWDSVFTGN